MKTLVLLGSLLTCALAQAAPYINVPPELVPTYIDPDVASAQNAMNMREPSITRYGIIDSTKVPWSFDMVKEPEILPIIPEVNYQVLVVNDELTITDYQISSDILFAFDKSTVDTQNRIFVKDVASHILSTYQTIDNVTVTGHTDRLGSDSYNEKLALRRAQTVQSILMEEGLSGMIRVVSMGEKMPVTDGCPNITPRDALKRCLAKDRRVEIRVEGKARTIDAKLTPQELKNQ